MAVNSSTDLIRPGIKVPTGVERFAKAVAGAVEKVKYVANLEYKSPEMRYIENGVSLRNQEIKPTKQVEHQAEGPDPLIEYFENGIRPPADKSKDLEFNEIKKEEPTEGQEGKIS